MGPTGTTRKEVKVGEANEYQVQILEGLAEGDVLALDARSRTAVEFKDDKSEDDAMKSAAPAKAAPAPGR